MWFLILEEIVEQLYKSKINLPKPTHGHGPISMSIPRDQNPTCTNCLNLIILYILYIYFYTVSKFHMFASAFLLFSFVKTSNLNYDEK